MTQLVATVNDRFNLWYVQHCSAREQQCYNETGELRYNDLAKNSFRFWTMGTKDGSCGISPKPSQVFECRWFHPNCDRCPGFWHCGCTQRQPSDSSMALCVARERGVLPSQTKNQQGRKRPTQMHQLRWRLKHASSAHASAWSPCK